MSDSLLVSLLLNISLLTLAATLMMELKPLRAFLYRAPDDWRLQLMLAALFGLLATLSTYCGFNAYGANINTRVISATAAARNRIAFKYFLIHTLLTSCSFPGTTPGSSPAGPGWPGRWG